MHVYVSFRWGLFFTTPPYPLYYGSVWVPELSIKKPYWGLHSSLMARLLRSQPSGPCSGQSCHHRGPVCKVERSYRTGTSRDETIARVVAGHKGQKSLLRGDWMDHRDVKNGPIKDHHCAQAKSICCYAGSEMGKNEKREETEAIEKHKSGHRSCKSNKAHTHPQRHACKYISSFQPF